MWFAPEILSAEAISSASRSRKMAPYSDISHPIVFRRSNLGLMDSTEASVDVVPTLASPPPLAPPMDAPAEDEAPSINGSTTRGVEKGLVLVDSQPSLDDAVSTSDALPTPDADRLAALGLSCSDLEESVVVLDLRPSLASRMVWLADLASGLLTRHILFPLDGLTDVDSFAGLVLRIIDEDRVAALGTVDASIMLNPTSPDDAKADLDSVPSSLPLEPEFARGQAVSPPSPLDVPIIHHDLTPLDVDPDSTPNTISRITMKYSLNTSNNLGHESSSPKEMSAASPLGKHLDIPKVKYIAMEAAASQHDSWKPIKPRRHRKSASKDAKFSALKCCQVVLRSWGWAD
ncbi:hypothetical protein Nepgr_031292 [Nepenthes gracilis]|uniref:Uncharacterized protein n=1 Tax=Nepenthes gracilis TaxID=150966 RepID=A0AAD3TI09_NEPGR|nr:hypothetical protein Nepgr_031292 [Nepenthes gracilis]